MNMYNGKVNISVLLVEIFASNVVRGFRQDLRIKRVTAALAGKGRFLRREAALGTSSRSGVKKGGKRN